MKKSIIVAAILLLLGLQANAQVIAGAGYIFSPMKTSDSESTIPYHGFYIGASYNLNLVAGLGVAPGLYISYMRYKSGDAGGSSTMGYLWNGYNREFALNLPVNLNYNFDLGNDKSIFLYAGPVFQLGITNTSTLNKSIDFGPIHYRDGDTANNYADGTAKRFNIYLGGGVGMQIGDVLFHVGYDQGLLDIYPNTKVSRGQLKIGFDFSF